LDRASHRSLIYIVRVFGCTGSTNVVVDAIDWAIAHNMQVISMSLGADHGTADDADAEASENAVDAGSWSPQLQAIPARSRMSQSDPGSGEKAISVAAVDSHDSFPGESLTLSPGGTIVAIDANGIPAGNVRWPSSC